MTGDARGRLRDFGLTVGHLPTGPWNAITDVPGVLVGHTTLIEGAGVRTGVTALRPHPGNLHLHRVPAGIAVGNGYGKLAGFTQVQELGELETPIVLSNTLAVGAGLQGLIRFTLEQPENGAVQSVNAVVGETNDGLLNDIRAQAVTPEHVLHALHTARTGPLAEGNVGAGTGTVAFGWKGGIGSSSRLVAVQDATYTLGSLVQSNYGGQLQICGVPIPWVPPQATPDGSIMIILATDAPLGERNLRRLARRALLALGRTGSSMSSGSGDYALAFSTAQTVRRTRGAVMHAAVELGNEQCTLLFQAAMEATEEAIDNSLFQARTMTGVNGRVVHALPVQDVLSLIPR